MNKLNDNSEVRNFPIYVGGEFMATQTLLEVRNPYSGELTGKTYLAGSSELELSITKALQCKAEMAAMPAFQRAEILMQIANSMREKRQELALLLAGESGKPLKYALGEIDRAAQTFQVASEESTRLPGEVLSIDWTPAGKGKEALVRYFPVGLIAGIAPFNFPMNLAVHKIAPAIASGNVIILKPARSTPLSVLALAEIINQTSLPKGAISILPMDRESGNQLVVDERINMLSFTGSPAVGWQMKRDAGKKKVCLELGGNAGVIVSNSVLNLEDAVLKCLTGSFAYSGQVCIHVQRLLVHQDVFEQFIHRFIELTRQLKQGNPLSPETDISSMIDEENALRVESWVNEAVAMGAQVLCGGKRINTYVEPTVMTHTTTEMKVCSLEIFGPVVSIEPYQHFEEAVALINDSEYGLQAGVFTDKLSEMNFAYQHLEVGGVIINDVPTFRVDHMPYGGIKNSGFGREGVKYAIQEMMEPKLLVKNT